MPPVTVKPGLFQTWQTALRFVAALLGFYLGVALLIWRWL